MVFKAEIGAWTPQVCQVQGMGRSGSPWRRISEAGMAAVAAMARTQVAPTVSLYVNSYNTAARRSYRAVGFREQSDVRDRPAVIARQCSPPRARARVAR